MSIEMPLKVLIVDDSLIFRRTIERILKSYSNIEIIGLVCNGLKAIGFILENQMPDLITLDVMMPEMNGLETLKKLKELHQAAKITHIPDVIMISSMTKEGATVTIEALNNGAFDFITKPDAGQIPDAPDILENAIKQKINNYIGRKNVANSSINQYAHLYTNSPDKPSGHIQAIGIAVSTGGPRALKQMLPQLCNVVDVPVFIAQHIPENFTQTLAESLGKQCSHEVIVGYENALVENKTVYIARGNKNMVVRGNTLNNKHIGITEAVSETVIKPSADVLFRSLTNIYKDELLLVVLTGMGNDGSSILPMAKRHGAYIIAQDKASSSVWGMPGAAVATDCVDKVVELMKIPEVVKKYLSK